MNAPLEIVLDPGLEKNLKTINMLDLFLNMFRSWQDGLHLKTTEGLTKKKKKKLTEHLRVTIN